MTEPTATKDRVAKRKRLLDDTLKTAHRWGLSRNRSLKCSSVLDGPPRHAGGPDGCANDGTTCLCECHDKPT